MLQDREHERKKFRPFQEVGALPLKDQQSSGDVEISIIVPAYNAGDTLLRCLKALAAQETGHAFEVLVIDSSADSYASEIVSQFPFARLLRSKVRLYPGAARNLGMRAVRGRCTFFLDAHNFAPPDWLERTHKYLHTGSSDIIGGSRQIGARATLVQLAQYLVEFMDFLPELSIRNAEFVPAGNTAMYSQPPDSAGFPEELRAAEDLVYFSRRRQQGALITFHPDLSVEYVPKKKFVECVKHLRCLGYWSGRARTSYRLPGKRGITSVFLLPLAVPYRFIKLALNVAKSPSISKLRFVLSLPIVLIYLTLWSVGQIQGVRSA